MLDELKNLLGHKEQRMSEREVELTEQVNKLTTELTRMKHREEDLNL